MSPPVGRDSVKTKSILKKINKIENKIAFAIVVE